MLSLWRLTLLCGLLIGPSCCLLDSILPLSSIHSSIDRLKDEAHALSLDLRDDFERLKFPLEHVMKTILNDFETLSGKALDAFISKVTALIGLKIEDMAYLSLKPELSADGNSLQLRLPASAAISMKLPPLISDLIKAQVNMDFLMQLKIVTDEKTGLSEVSLGECLVDESTLKITILNGAAGLKARLAESLTAMVKKLIPSIMKKRMCPLMETFAKVMDVQKVQDVIDYLKTHKSMAPSAILR
ncbi:BPI fold-containing family A member 2 [Antechinus flavipes]|uniref:BPI fold-containing family A member 2 n=1 Tax=Antechinus flavipes TaxID=38775 RepID=UPI002235C681|nr:BPI fold-containing family A member 2 [Antechinus flavipes]